MTADGLVVVLDGASAFDPTEAPDASDYVDVLAENLIAAYATWPAVSLSGGLAWAISATADTLEITPGTGPSSTVAAIRWTGPRVEVLALGDSPVIVQTDASRDVLADDALKAIAPELREKYRAALAAGGGFSPEHRAILAELQRRQAAVRNRPGGYWIAEADPEAAGHAIERTYAASDVLWCAAVTDGAQHPAEYLGYEWDAIAKLDAAGLFDLLVELHHWENTEDPAGSQLLRSKRHDDKTVARVRQPS